MARPPISDVAPVASASDARAQRFSSATSDLERLEMELLLLAIYRHHGFDFRAYAPASLHRRIRRHGTATPADKTPSPAQNAAPPVDDTPKPVHILAKPVD